MGRSVIYVMTVQRKLPQVPIGVRGCNRSKYVLMLISACVDTDHIERSGKSVGVCVYNNKVQRVIDETQGVRANNDIQKTQLTGVNRLVL